MNAVALGLGDQILFSVTSSFSIVLNTIFSVIFLKESLIHADFLAIFLICIGATLFLLVAKNDSEMFSKEQLYDLYTRPIIFVFFICAGSIILIIYLFYLVTKRKIERFYLKAVNTSAKEDVVRISELNQL